MKNVICSRKCPNCNELMYYNDTYSMKYAERDEIHCKICAKLIRKGLLKTKYFKKCDANNCENIIYYNRPGDCGEAIKKKSKRKECTNKILREYYSDGLHSHQSVEVKNEIYKKIKSSQLKYFQTEDPEVLKKHKEKRAQRRREVGSDFLKTNEHRNKMSIIVTKWHDDNPEARFEIVKKVKKVDPYYYVKAGKKLQQWHKENPEKHCESVQKMTKTQNTKEYHIRRSKIGKEWIKKHPEKHYDIQKKILENKCKAHDVVHNIKCQGSSEKAYIEYLFNNNIPLPSRCSHGVKTKYGIYFPDFEYENRYIEIKSTYTYSFLKENNNKQYLKIKETSKINKPVHIIVINKNKTILKTEIIDESNSSKILSNPI